MKLVIRKLLLLSVAILFGYFAYSQEKMEVEGAIIIKDSEDNTPALGTIRYNPTTNDFEGYNGGWQSLTDTTPTTPKMIQISSGNGNSNIIQINHPDLNGNPNAFLTVTHFFNSNHLPAIGVWYTSSKWYVFTEDVSLIPPGEKFNIVYIKN